MDGILGTKNRIVMFFNLIEGTYIVSDSIYDNVWGAEYEQTGAFNDGV